MGYETTHEEEEGGRERGRRREGEEEGERREEEREEERGREGRGGEGEEDCYKICKMCWSDALIR